VKNKQCDAWNAFDLKKIGHYCPMSSLKQVNLTRLQETLFYFSYHSSSCIFHFSLRPWQHFKEDIQ